MPGHARLWIYQANRALTASEKEYLGEGLKDLCDQWSAHGVPLRTSYTLPFDRFAVLAVDEGASGCSIDSSIRFLKGLQGKLGIDFFDRSQVAFLKDGKVISFSLKDLKGMFENQALTADTIAFNNLVVTKEEWEKQWQSTVRDSWIARHLPKSAVTQ